MQNQRTSSPYVLTIASGKGGVGKTLLTVNLADQLVRRGMRVGLVDADLGMSDCAAMLNRRPPGTLAEVIRGECRLQDIVNFREQPYLLTASASPDEPLGDDGQLMNALDYGLQMLRQRTDIILIDSPAGLSEVNLWALDRSDLGVLVMLDEPTVISDVYRFAKYVLDLDPAYPLAAAVNFAKSAGHAHDVLKRFNKILNHFRNRTLPPAGHLSADHQVGEAIRRQRLLAQLPEARQRTDEIEQMVEAILGHLDHNEEPLQMTS